MTDPSANQAAMNGTANEDDVETKFKVYSQLPLSQWKESWTKAEVDQAIRQHELGQFNASAVLMDSMTRDDAVDAVLSARVDGLLGLDLDIEPGKSDGAARGNKKIAGLVTDRFNDLFPLAITAPLLRCRIMMGFAIAQVIWEPNEDNSEWVPRAELWHPSYVYVDLTTHTYYALTTEGPVPVKGGSGQWILYAPQGTRYAWMSGAVRSIANPWLARQFTWRDWLRANELYSTGIRKAIVPNSASAPEKKQFFNQVANMGANPTVMVPAAADKDTPGFDIQVLFPPAGNGASGFDTLMSKAESKIAIRINGQNLTTEAKGGSFAAAKVHENVQAGILDSDSRSLGQCLSEQVLEPYIEFHDFPPNTAPPVIMWNTAPPDDLQKAAAGALAIGQALAAFGSAHAPADPRALLMKYDIPVLPEGDPIPGPPAAPAPGVPVVPPTTGDVPAPSTDGGSTGQGKPTAPGGSPKAVSLDAGDGKSDADKRAQVAKLEKKHKRLLVAAMLAALAAGGRGSTVRKRLGVTLAAMRMASSRLGQTHLLSSVGSDLAVESLVFGTAARDRLMSTAISGLAQDALTAKRAPNEAEKTEALASASAKAEQIAATETHRAYNAGIASAAKRANVSLKWEADPEACDECDDLDGDTEWDDEPPLHPNCKCTICPA